jgi:hypothetical protein
MVVQEVLITAAVAVVLVRLETQMALAKVVTEYKLLLLAHLFITQVVEEVIMQTHLQKVLVEKVEVEMVFITQLLDLVLQTPAAEEAERHLLLEQQAQAAQVSLSLDTPHRREIFTAVNGHVDEVVLLLA